MDSLHPSSGISDLKNARLLTPDKPTNSHIGHVNSSAWGVQQKTKKNAPTEVLTPQAERFRMRLIRDFRLLENLNEMEQGLEAPKYHPEDVEDPKKQSRLLRENPYALVKFRPIPKLQGTVNKQERRWKRIKCRETKYPPIDLWANWVVESNWFQNFMLILIIFNAILLVAEAEIGEMSDDPNYVNWIRLIRSCDYCCLLIFIMEILLKWISDFKSFWTNGWNEMDFYITLVSVLPELIKWSGADLGNNVTLMSVLSFLRVLRITRLLKMVSRFEQAQIILMSVSKAFSAMTFILLLLGLFMWMFALMGQVVFERYTFYDGRKDGTKLLYQNAFNGTMWSFATLFQLMTLDHWLETLRDLLLVMRSSYDSTVTIFYILAWIWLGSFVFKNIFAGIMVNNFQTIRNDLHWEKKEKEAREEVDKIRTEFTEEVTGVSEKEDVPLEGQRKKSVLSFFVPTDSQTSVVSQQKNFGATLNIPGNSLLAVARSNESVMSQENTTLAESFMQKRSALSQLSQLNIHDITSENKLPDFKVPPTESEEKIYKAHWENIVQTNLSAVGRTKVETVWPRDALFRYYYIMERLQENIQERTEILKLTSLAFLHIHDRS